MSIAVVFPGQGSQAPGAGRPWRDHPAWAVVDEAEAATGLPLAHLLLDATAEELANTRDTQLSVLLSSLVVWRAIEPTLEATDLVALAGHSLGQITALVAAGSLTLADGIHLAVARAEATAAAQASRPGGMLAFLGATESLAWEACDASPGRAWVANVNGAGQVVVGGEADALEAVARRAEEVGIRRVRPLAVDGAFHTPLMQPAADALRPALDAAAFARPRVPIVANDGTVVADGEGWPDRLATHLTQPVRWDEVVSGLVRLGATTIVEAGPGNTLASLNKRIAPDVATHSISEPSGLLDEARR